MSYTKHFIAVDLGASGGRVVNAAFDGSRLSLIELHRFEHHPVFVPQGGNQGKYCWDCFWIWSNILLGLKKASKQIEGEICSIAIDSWGVDYGLITHAGTLACPPAAYRDQRTDTLYEHITGELGKQAVYERTGITPMSINTLYQLAADAKASDQPLERAQSMLMTPALYAYWLTGETHAEHTLASTSQLYDSKTMTWIDEYCSLCNIPAEILPKVLAPGELIGTLRPAIAEQTGLPPATPVVTTGSHDSASAVLAAPLKTSSHNTRAYLSSGTWSLIGMELEQQCATATAYEAGFTNEAGIASTTRFHRNLTGLWLLQECRHAWNVAGENYTFAELEQLAAQEAPTQSVFDVNAPELAVPGDMPKAIAAQCEKQGLPVPQTPGAMARAIYESLAHEYARSLASAQEITGKTLDSIAVVGGGVRSNLLNALTANTTGLPVVTGSPEATSLGNALGQAVYLGAAANVADCREIAMASFDPKRFEPETAKAQ